MARRVRATVAAGASACVLTTGWPHGIFQSPLRLPGRPVAQAVDLLGVFAELGEVPGRVFGLDVGFGGQHSRSFPVLPAAAPWGLRG